MRRFRFRLQGLRNLAEARERLQRVKTAQTEAALAGALEDLEHQKRLERETAARFERAREAGGRPSELLRALDAVEVKAEAVTAARGEAGRRGAEADRERAVLEARRSERRSLDRLRDRQAARHRNDAARRADREADDRAAARRKEVR